jgi:DNA-cytosine methyltransferase
MKVLSLFNGMSFGRMALDSMGVQVSKYYSSEIDKYANQAAQALFPDTIQLGDVTQWREWAIDWSSIDLVTGGFPCQAWSMAGKQLGDKDERGMLFWVMLDIIKHVKALNPNADFLIENVKMKKEFEAYITTHTESALGKVHKILINSALVSAQNRNRYYWTSFAVEQPEDKGILLKDIIESGVVDQEKSYCIDANYHKGGNLKSYFEKHRRQLVFTNDLEEKILNISAMDQVENGKKGDYINVADEFYYSEKSVGYMNQTNEKWMANGKCRADRYLQTIDAEKAFTLTANFHKGVPYNYLRCPANQKYRKLTPRECFRLQTVPEHHIDTLLSANISNTQLYKMCGNGWTHDVIAHIFKAFANQAMPIIDYFATQNIAQRCDKVVTQTQRK